MITVIVWMHYGTIVCHPSSILDPLDRFFALLGTSSILLEQSSGLPDHLSGLLSPLCHTLVTAENSLQQYLLSPFTHCRKKIHFFSKDGYGEKNNFQPSASVSRLSTVWLGLSKNSHWDQNSGLSEFYVKNLPAWVVSWGVIRFIPQRDLGKH